MTNSPAPGWRSYANGRMLAVLVLGFSSGLPLFILLYLLQAWLAKSGLNVKALGLFALVQFPYIWKFLWAPLMDRYPILGLGRRARLDGADPAGAVFRHRRHGHAQPPHADRTDRGRCRWRGLFVRQPG